MDRLAGMLDSLFQRRWLYARQLQAVAGHTRIRRAVPEVASSDHGTTKAVANA